MLIVSSLRIEVMLPVDISVVYRLGIILLREAPHNRLNLDDLAACVLNLLHCNVPIKVGPPEEGSGID